VSLEEMGLSLSFDDRLTNKIIDLWGEGGRFWFGWPWLSLSRELQPIPGIKSNILRLFRRSESGQAKGQHMEIGQPCLAHTTFSGALLRIIAQKGSTYAVHTSFLM
jgi:hypothetical protein